MTDTGDSRGCCIRTRLPTFRRCRARRPHRRGPVVLDPGLAAGTRADVPAESAAVPGVDLVVQRTRTVLSGPTTSASYRDLHGHGWAVGTLLRPAGLAGIHQAPKEIRDIEIGFEAPGLYESIRAAMTDPAMSPAGPGRRTLLPVASNTFWNRMRLHCFANTMEDVVSGDRSVLRVDDLAERLAVSVRTFFCSGSPIGMSGCRRWRSSGDTGCRRSGPVARRTRHRRRRRGRRPRVCRSGAFHLVSLGRLGCRPPRTGGISGISGGSVRKWMRQVAKGPRTLRDPRDFVASASGIKTIGHDHIRNPAPSSLRPQGSRRLVTTTFGTRAIVASASGIKDVWSRWGGVYERLLVAEFGLTSWSARWK